MVITARQRSLGQGNVFTGVCLSTVGPLYDVTSYLAAWFHVLYRGSPSLVPCSFKGMGLCRGGLCRGECLSRGVSVVSVKESLWKGTETHSGWVRILLECILVAKSFSKWSISPLNVSLLVRFSYKARHAHKRLYTVLPEYSKIQVLPGITSCRLVKDNKQAIELNSLLLNNMPKDGYGWN